MTFSEYLFYNKLQLRHVAPKLFIDKNYLSALLRGRNQWSPKISQHIESFTDGLVKAQDLSGKFQTDIDEERYQQILKEN